MEKVTLTSLGFTRVGVWEKTSLLAIEAKYSSDQWANQNGVVYGFCDEVTHGVKYVGKTENTLGERMTQYQNAKIYSDNGPTFLFGNETNERVKKHILASSNTISIWCIEPKDVQNFSSYQGLSISKLEEKLLATFYLEWNKSGNQWSHRILHWIKQSSGNNVYLYCED